MADESMRVTIMLEKDLASKLRKIQADKIKSTQDSYSFSQAICDTLRSCLK